MTSLMNESHDIDEVHGLLIHLCEQQRTLSDEALFCVMEAFNDLSELHPPIRVCEPSVELAVDRLGRALELLDRLVDGSQRLEQTLALLQVRGLVSQALQGQP